MNGFFANLVFQLKDDAGSDVLEYSRSTCFFQLFGSFDKLVLFFIDEKNGPTTNSVWLRVKKNIAFSYQKSRCLGATNKLMR